MLRNQVGFSELTLQPLISGDNNFTDALSGDNYFTDALSGDNNFRDAPQQR
jgi:hypothetical protein